MDAGMKELTDVVLSWRNDPVLFVRDMFGGKPTEQQAALLAAAGDPGAHVAVKSGHGTGKSTALAWLMLWGLVCFGNDYKAPCTAPTKHQLEDILWAEARKWRPRMLEPWKSYLCITADKISMEGLPGYAAARTGRKENPEALQGFHAGELLFLIDEASGIDDTIFTVARGSLSTPGARVVMTSNPTRATGFFHRAFHADRDRWKTITFSGEDSPLVAPEYVKEMEDEYGRDSDIFRVRVLGEFPSGGDLQFIKTADVEAAFARAYPPGVYDRAPRVLGVDVAAYGGDRTVIVERQGLRARVLWQVPGVDTHVVSGEVARIMSGGKYQAVFVDETGGYGFGVVSELRGLGYSPFGVQFAGSPIDRQYKNKRAEIWGLTRKWLADEGGWIDEKVYADRLRDDLTGPEYQYDMQGRLQLERKEDMKKRGLASPDFGDALALTFALPVAPAAGGRRFENSPGMGIM
jgi:hypothetical protein